MNKIIILLALTAILSAASVAEQVWKMPASKRTHETIQIINLPLNIAENDPLLVTTVPEGKWGMVILHYEDVSVQDMLGDKTYNLLSHDSTVKFSRVVKGHVRPFPDTGNLYYNAGEPIILTVDGGSKQGLTGNIRVMIRIGNMKP